MKFLSIKEYFYKLTTLGFTLLLLPILVFAFLEYRSLFELPPVFIENRVMEVVYAFLIISIVSLTTVHWLYIFQIRKSRSLIEIAKKMDKFYSLSFLKMGAYCASSLLMAIGFLLTANMIFTVAFIVLSLAMVLQWPSRGSFCRWYELRGKEQEIIMTSGDLYKRNKKV